MIRRLRARLKKASYSYYVWENGGYVHVDCGEHATSAEATSAAVELTGGSIALERPASLDTPHLHVVREEGIHILTLELPGEAAHSLAA